MNQQEKKSSRHKETTQKKTINSRVQENFYTIIVFLVLFFTAVLIASLFYPIQTDGLPETEQALTLLQTGLEQRTILIRSISSIISGISVMVAFISLMQSKESDPINERLQIKPFPAYAIPKKDMEYAASMKVTFVKEVKETDVLTENDFTIRIKNIGLGSLVDYDICDIHLEDVRKKDQQFDVSSTSNFTLGQEEIGQIGFNMATAFDFSENIQSENLERLSVSCVFKDLLGNTYKQAFTILFDVQLTSEDIIPVSHGRSQTRKEYTLHPLKIVHSPPLLQPS